MAAVAPFQENRSRFHSLLAHIVDGVPLRLISPLDVDLFASGTIWSRRRFNAPRRQSAFSIAAPGEFRAPFLPLFFSRFPPLPSGQTRQIDGYRHRLPRTAVRLKPGSGGCGG